MRVVLLLVALLVGQSSSWRLVRGVGKVVASIGLGASLSICNPVVAHAEQNNVLAQQLQLLQAKTSENQAALLAKQDQELLTKELLMPEGQLIARGIVTITCDKIDKNVFPYGFSTASDLDGVFDSDKSRLFLLAVGRDGNIPLAAKSIPLKGTTFPLVVELETKDLLFPYNLEAWTASSNRMDTIAVSAFISPNEKIAVPSSSVRVGFALSDPVTIAGKLSRSTAQLSVGGGKPLDVTLFTQPELDLLSAVDAGIAKNLAAQPK